MSQRGAKEPAVGEGPPNDARVDPVLLSTPAPAKQTIALIKQAETPSPTAVSSVISVTSASKSSVSKSSALSVSTKTTTTSATSNSSISSSNEATSTLEASNSAKKISQSTPPSQPTPSALPKSIIIGAAIGGVFSICVFAFLAFLLFRRRRQQKSRNTSLEPKSSLQASCTKSGHSNSQLYSRVSTSSNNVSSSMTTFGFSEVIIGTHSVQPEMLPYSHPIEEDARRNSLAEADTRLFAYMDSRRLSGGSDGSSFYAPSEQSVGSREEEEGCLRSGCNHFQYDIERPLPSGSESMTAMPIPRKSSKRKITGWNVSSVDDNNSVEIVPGERPVSGLVRRSEAESVISEVDHLIARWDTVSIKTNEGRRNIENKREDYAVRKMSMGNVSVMDSQ